MRGILRRPARVDGLPRRRRAGRGLQGLARAPGARCAATFGPRVAARPGTFLRCRLRCLPRGPRHRGAGPAGSGPHARRQPEITGRRHARQPRRHDGRLDRRHAGPQARQPDAVVQLPHGTGTARARCLARKPRMKLPNALPRPAGELEALSAVWQQPRGIRILTAVNNTYIGLFYVGAALLFLVLAGILALLMRAQLALPGNDFIDHDTYNQLFTMHGSVMMFRSAGRVGDAPAPLLRPRMRGPRDLPSPRLSPSVFGAYAMGGLIFFCTLFSARARKGGWLMPPPLTSWQF